MPFLCLQLGTLSVTDVDSIEINLTISSMEIAIAAAGSADRISEVLETRLRSNTTSLRVADLAGCE